MKATRSLLGLCLGIATLLLGPVALPAQHISIGFGSPRVAVRASLDLGPRVHHGRWVLQRERVWVPGCRRLIHVPARWGYRYDSCGRRVRVLISPARERIVEEPGHWEWRTRRVWVPAHRRYR
jgi:hypothetical protein